MKQKRSLFDMFFGRTKYSHAEKTTLRMMNGYVPTFTAFSGEAYDSDIVRATVDSIARHAAKFKPKHIRRVDGHIQAPTQSSVEKLLQVRPNPFHDAFTFYYKVVTTWCMQNNSFIFIDFDPTGVVRGFYPFAAATTEFLESGGEMFVKFSFLGGQNVILPYANVIHLRRFFYKHDLFGESNDRALTPTLDLISTTDQGISNAVKSSASLRGLLKFTQSMLKPEDLKKQRDDFVKDYLDVTNNGGVAALDSKADYTPLDNEPKMVSAAQMKAIELKVYRYFSVNEKIVMSSYNEDEFNAFYESVLEPLAIQMSLEFTSKIFSNNAQGRGNEIIFESNRLQYASMTTKLNLREMVDRGAMTPNEWREALNMAPVEGGDKPIRRLDTAEVKTKPVSKEEGSADETTS